MFHGAPSENLLEDDFGKGSIGQQQAPKRSGEYLMAFLDDLYIVTLADGVGPCARLFKKNSESVLGLEQERDQQHVMPLRG